MKRTNSEMIQEIYNNHQTLMTVLLGVPNSEDGGLVETVKTMAKEFKEMNGTVRTNTAWRKAICWVVGLETGVLVTMATFLLVRM